MTLNNYFARRRVRFDLLAAFGFKKKGGAYIYKTPILDGQFIMHVLIYPDETVRTSVIDVETDDPYVLHQTDAQGEFVGRVRKEYEAVLNKMNAACFEDAVYKTAAARGILNYIRETYQDNPEFLWKRTPDFSVFRRKDSQKWYAVLMIIPKNKLGLSGDEKTEVMNVRMHRGHEDILIDNKNYFKAYHMNKGHWLSILLDGSLEMSELARRIDDSYILARR